MDMAGLYRDSDLIVTAVFNGANLTDGLDGLATGTSAIVGATPGILAYVSSNMVYADYLKIMYIPHSEELVIFASAFIGATIGFLWYNSFPAQVFMAIPQPCTGRNNSGVRNNNQERASDSDTLRDILCRKPFSGRSGCMV